MTLRDFDKWIRSFIPIDDFSKDPSQNGIQVQNADLDAPVAKIAFAVDACFETIERAAENGCGILFVHHGLFWGHEQKITGRHYRRIASLIRNNIALYACHIPLDANVIAGNNYGLAERLNLQNIEGFGIWNGMSIGTIGDLEQEATVDEIAKKLFPDGEKPRNVLPFGKKLNKRIAIISGGAGEELDQAITSGADVYITGEIGHQEYHVALESGINVIAGGHYQTETVGPRAVMNKLAKEQKIETVFIDIPTGL